MPPALAGEKGIYVELALAKIDAILAKAIINNPILFLQLKLEAIQCLENRMYSIVAKKRFNHLFEKNFKKRIGLTVSRKVIEIKGFTFEEIYFSSVFSEISYIFENK